MEKSGFTRQIAHDHDDEGCHIARVPPFSPSVRRNLHCSQVSRPMFSRAYRYCLRSRSATRSIPTSEALRLWR